MDLYRQWLLDALEKTRAQGKSRSGLARHLNKDAAAITKMLREDKPQRIPASLLPAMAAYLGVSLPVLASHGGGAGPTSRVVYEGVLAMGVWREDIAAAGGGGTHFIPSVPDPDYEHLAQYARAIEDNVIDDVYAGDYGIFVRYADVRPAPRDRDVVHVRRRNGLVSEDSLRRVQIRGRDAALVVDKGPASEKSVKINEPGLEIRGLLIGTFRPRTYG